MEKKTIGSFIAVLRKASGMTQRQLAEKLNVSDKAVSRWERDESLPDLPLIPVLADIFGVTSDELLRGCRSNAEAPTAQENEKSKKQLQYLLDKTCTNYKIQTLISLLVAGVGVIAAAILNLAFLRAVAGFWVGCVFFLGAAVLQMIFKISFDARLQGEEFAGEALTACKTALGTYNYWCAAAIAAMFAFTLPLLGVEDAYMGLRLEYWLTPTGREIAWDGQFIRYPSPALIVLAVALLLHKRRQRKPVPFDRKLFWKTAGFTLLAMLASYLLLGLLDELLWNLGLHNRYYFSLVPVCFFLWVAEPVAGLLIYWKKAQSHTK